MGLKLVVEFYTLLIRSWLALQPPITKNFLEVEGLKHTAKRRCGASFKNKQNNFVFM